MEPSFVFSLPIVPMVHAEADYQDSAELFACTYLTEGMRLVAGTGGEPVVQLKTAFGPTVRAAGGLL